MTCGSGVFYYLTEYPEAGGKVVKHMCMYCQPPPPPPSNPLPPPSSPPSPTTYPPVSHDNIETVSTGSVDCDDDSMNEESISIVQMILAE